MSKLTVPSRGKAAPRPSRIRREPARPSRIRRDPIAVEAERPRRIPWWASREWEIRLAIGGIIFFALAISAMVLDVGEVLSH